jgi:peptidoglycan hydrolase-like protein with peptidoglycan-binding domain
MNMPYNVRTMKKSSIILTLLILSFNTADAQESAMELDVPTPCANLTHNMRLGSNDTQVDGDVSGLQTFLQDEGYLKIDPTGYFGNSTFKAVKKFQAKYGISQVGSVGSITRKKIQILSCELESDPLAVEVGNSTSSLGGLTLLAQPKSILKLLPPLTFTFPLASSTIKMGQSYNITWDTTDVSNLVYTAHLIGGVFGTTDIVLGKANAGSKTLSWQVPSSLSPGSTYKIFIESEIGGRVSSNDFSIVPPDQNTPVIRSLNSTQGGRGDRIVISGSNFSTRVTLSLVQFLKEGKVVATLDPSIKNPYAISIDGTQINLVIDPIFAANAEPGTYQMRIANPFGDGYAFSNTVNFTLTR